MSTNYRAADAAKVDATTRLVELLATIGSLLLIMITLPFSLCCLFKVVQEYERSVVFQMGRVKGGPRGPSTFVVMPCIDHCVRVDLSTVSFDVPPQEVLTKDSVTVSVDAVVYYRIQDPLSAVIKIANYRKDVRLPVQLQRAMATEAEAAREVRAKVIAAEGEMRASHSLKEAGDVISTSPVDLQNQRKPHGYAADSGPENTVPANADAVPEEPVRAEQGRLEELQQNVAGPEFLVYRTAPPPYPRIHPKTLAAKSSRRIVDLALPRKRNLLEAMQLARTRSTKATVSDLLVKVRKSRYQRYRVFCNARQEREAKKKRRLIAKLRKALTKPEDWQRHMRALERLAAPKAARPEEKPIKKRKWQRVSLKRLERLAQPIVREMPKPRDPFAVAASALTYQITKRMEQLTITRKRPEILLRIPGAVTPAAMRATASQRIIALAKPVARPVGMETDLRENAFTVSPMALKAKCSRRIKRLAKPKSYPKPTFKTVRPPRPGRKRR